MSLAFVEKNHSVGYYSWIIQQFYLVFDLENNSYADRTNKAETRVFLSMSCLVTLVNLQPIRQVLEERNQLAISLVQFQAQEVFATIIVNNALHCS